MRELADRVLEDLFELDGAPGPAREINEVRACAIIAGALGGAGFPPIGGGDGGGSVQLAGPPSASGIAASKLVWLAGGAATLALGTGAWLGLGTPHRSPPPLAAVATAAAAAASAAVSPGAAGEPAPPAPAAAGGAVPAVSMKLAESQSPRGRGSHAAKSRAGHPPQIAAPGRADAPPEASRPMERGALAQSAEGPPPVARDRAPSPVIADDFLARANAARAAHRWRDADALYSLVVSEGHAELAVQTALVASASLHLEHLGDPRGAALRFRAALAAGSVATLAEDARWGIAEAARATGDAPGEAGALDDFLAHHAGSPLASRARARRAQLGDAP